MIKISCKILIHSLIFLILSCSGLYSQSDNEKILAIIGNEKIFLSEFESSFLKALGNNPDSAKNTDLQQKKDYLELLINLKLKVNDAIDKGYLEFPGIKEDLLNFKKNYLSTFLIDKEVVEPNIRDLWEKRKYEVRASHIMVILNSSPTSEDSIKAYQKSDEILKRLKDGEDFGLVAKEMSDDVGTKNNGGDLYYFTGGMTVRQFEDAVYSLNVGEYTRIPVRSIFGLHIIKLTDKKKRNDGIRASHILIQDIRDSQTGNIVDSVTSYNQIKEIAERIKNGEDFAQLADEYSQDPGSKTKGGDLGFFDRRRMTQPFDSAAFSLQIGEVSGIVRTQFGWHLIKLTDIKEFQPYEIQHDNLKSEFKRRQDYKIAYDNYIDKCLYDYNFKIDQNGFGILKSKLEIIKDYNNLDSVLSDLEKKSIVATFTGGEVNIEDATKNYFGVRDYSPKTGLDIALTKSIQNTAAIAILNMIAEKENIEQDEAYLDLYNNYMFSILKSKIDDEEINNKIVIAENDINTYYNENKEKFGYKDGNVTKYKNLNEIKGEINLALRTKRFGEFEYNYLNKLKEKYPVVIYVEVLENAFKN